MYVRNLIGEEFPLQATLTHEMELNGNQNVSATIRATKVNSAFIDDITEMWELVDFDDVAHKIIYAKKKGEGDSLTVDVKAIPLFFDTFDTLRIYEEYNEHMTAQLAFTRIFKDTGFNFVLVDAFDAVQWEGFGGGESRLETFKRALERYQAEFRISGNTVYLQKRIGRDTQFQYRYRLNASNITQENDASAMWTYAKGYGDYEDGGEEGGGGGWETAKLIREYTSPLAKIPGIGIRHAPPIKDGRIKVRDAMDKALKDLVDESLKISVSADSHDLRRQGYQLAQSELGDRVFLIDERIELDAEVRVVNIKLMRNWKGEVLDLNLTFGSEGLTKRHQSNMNTAMKDITDIMAGRKKIPFSAYDAAVINATNALKGITSQLVVPENGGLMAVDKNNPNNVVLFNAAGIGVSTDGGATFGQAMTGNGINASYVTTGMLDANQVVVRGGNSSAYTYIHDDEIELRGRHTRTWQGSTKTFDTLIHFHRGYMKMNDATSGQSLYYTQYGVSTYGDGNQDESSGTIEFFSYDYHPIRKGITISSVGGVAALRSGLERVIIDAYDHAYIMSNQQQVRIQPRNHLAGNNTFAFHVVDDADASLQDGIIYFGSENNPSWSSGLRWSKQLNSNTLSVTNGTGAWGTGNLEVYNLKVNNRMIGGIEAPTDNAYAYVNNAFKVMNKSGNALRDLEVRDAIMNEVIFGSLRTADVNTNTYIGVGSNELRVTNNQFYNGGNTVYRDVRARNYLLPSGDPAFQNTFSLLSMPPQENEASEIVKDINVVRHTSNGQPEFKIADDSHVATSDGSATDIEKTLGYTVKALQELIVQVEELKGAS